MPRKLLKIMCTAVSVEHDDAGEVVGEVEGTATACYSADQLQAYFGAVKKELDAWNAQNAPPNRAARRARQPRRKK